MNKGIIITGKFGEIVARQRSDAEIELGELLVADNKDERMLFQVYDIQYSSQLSSQNLELVSGMKIEEDDAIELFEPHLRNYKLAMLKSLATVKEGKAYLTKGLPDFFSYVREITSSDVSFITKPENPLFIGRLRSGSKMLDVDIFLPGKNVLTHHMLIAATTGRGKSNLSSVMLWGLMDQRYAGVLVLDPHDEYYGRHKLGLKDHSGSRDLVYYTPNDPPVGARSLKINIKKIRPGHFNGVMDWSDPQREALSAYHKRFKEDWIVSLMLEKETGSRFNEGTIAVVKRRLMQLLGIDFFEDRISFRGVFDDISGESTVKDICSELEQGKLVIVDTSSFSGNVEILIGSMITTEVFNRYKEYKNQGILDQKPVISIFLEEAPRVIGKEVLEKGENIFSTIAREGRKFSVGLCAITQLPSLIPREILANMNTKIIMGIEMQPERQAIIDSASQDLTSDSRAIASLDKGEAIITSNFTKFAIPVKIPLFEDIAKEQKKEKIKMSFSGVRL